MSQNHSIRIFTSLTSQNLVENVGWWCLFIPLEKKKYHLDRTFAFGGLQMKEHPTKSGPPHPKIWIKMELFCAFMSIHYSFVILVDGYLIRLFFCLRCSTTQRINGGCRLVEQARKTLAHGGRSIGTCHTMWSSGMDGGISFKIIICGTTSRPPKYWKVRVVSLSKPEWYE